MKNLIKILFINFAIITSILNASITIQKNKEISSNKTIDKEKISKKELEILDKYIDKFVTKDYLIKIKKRKEEAKKLEKSFTLKKYGSFYFRTPKAKQILKIIDKKFKQCLQDPKYKLTNFCYDKRFQNLMKLKEFDMKEYYFYFNKINNYKKGIKSLVLKIIYYSPTYQKYRKLKFKCMNQKTINDIKQCFKKNQKELKKLKIKVKKIKEYILKKIKEKEKKSITL
jgi:hypothetical protein